LIQLFLVLGDCGFVFRIRRQGKEEEEEEESGFGVVAEAKIMALLGQQEMRSGSIQRRSCRVLVCSDVA
jgi:hypothetical protein